MTRCFLHFVKERDTRKRYIQRHLICNSRHSGIRLSVSKNWGQFLTLVHMTPPPQSLAVSAVMKEFALAKQPPMTGTAEVKQEGRVIICRRRVV